MNLSLIMFVVAAALFFLVAVGVAVEAVALLPLGLFFLALGLIVGQLPPRT